MKQAHADCWIIHGGTRAIERWFVEHRVRGITVGWSNEEVHLPCLGVDYRAICRHAVGVFLARGHRRLTMLLPGEATDDQDHEQGFLEGLRAAGGHPEVQGRVVRHDGTVKSIQRALRDIRRSDPPSGLLVVRPKFALTAPTCLLNSGLKMPRDVSLISTGYEPYLENLSPSVAHYAINWSSFARRLFRMVLRQATVGTVSLSPVLVTAEFRPGETLAAKK
jgi:DNA-binding LacI/PurR family transcriptional regulator